MQGQDGDGQMMRGEGRRPQVPAPQAAPDRQGRDGKDAQPGRGPDAKGAPDRRPPGDGAPGQPRDGRPDGGPRGDEGDRPSDSDQE
jgi:hypothetical protein